MRRIVVLLLIASLSASIAATSAEAAKRKKPKRVERTVEATYDAPAAAVMTAYGVRGVCYPGGALGCLNFTASSNEAFAAIRIEDSSGQPVHALVEDAQSEAPLAEICGATEGRVFLQGASIIRVWLLLDPCPNGTPSVATQGIVAVTFTNLP